MLINKKWPLLNQLRHKTTITSFRQWKDLLVFKRHDSKHVWNLPKFIPHEFGFRRIKRKPPFFKSRKFAFPPIVTDYNPSTGVLYNRDLFLRYGWDQRSREFHQLKDYITNKFRGLNVIGIPSQGRVLELLDENEKLILDLTNPKDIENLDKLLQ